MIYEPLRDQIRTQLLSSGIPADEAGEIAALTVAAASAAEQALRDTIDHSAADARIQIAATSAAISVLLPIWTRVHQNLMDATLVTPGGRIAMATVRFPGKAES